MRQRGLTQLVHVKTLRDVVPAQRAVRADVVGLAAIFHGGHLFKHRLTNLHGRLVMVFFYTVGASVAAAPFNGVELRLGNQLKHFFGFATDVLHPTMAGNLVTHVTQGFRKFRVQQAVAFACHQVLKRVPHGGLDQLGVGIIGEH